MDTSTWSKSLQNTKHFLFQTLYAMPTTQETIFLSPTQFFYLTHTSKRPISIILMQENNSNFLPVSYVSRTLKNDEARYHSNKLHTMVIAHGVQALRYHLYGCKITIFPTASLLNSRPNLHLLLSYVSKL